MEAGHGSYNDILCSARNIDNGCKSEFARDAGTWL